MPNIITTNNDLGSPILEAASFLDDTLTLGGAVTVLAGTILARDSGTKKLVLFVKGGVVNGNGIPKAILIFEITSTGAGDAPVRVGVAGKYRKERLVIDADGDDSNIDSVVIDQLRDYGLMSIDVRELNFPDNQGFLFSDLPGLRVWVDAADLSTITESGGLVSQWNNKGAGNDFIQAVGISQPTTGVNTLNGRNVLDFNLDFMSGGDFAVHGTQGLTVYMVVKTISADFQLQFSKFATGVNGTFYAGHLNETGIFATSGGLGRRDNTISNPRDVWNVITTTFDNSLVRTYLDGVLLNSIPQTSPLQTNAFNVVVGAGTTGSFLSTMSLAEILAYDRFHDSSLQNKLDLDLKIKWDTP